VGVWGGGGGGGVCGEDGEKKGGSPAIKRQCVGVQGEMVEHLMGQKPQKKA